MLLHHIELNVNDYPQFPAAQRFEDYGLIQAVDELWPVFLSRWDLITRALAMLFLLPAPLSGLAHIVLTNLQMRSQLFLRIKHPPLHRSDRDSVGRGDLVVLPLLDETQLHDFTLA